MIAPLVAGLLVTWLLVGALGLLAGDISVWSVAGLVATGCACGVWLLGYVVIELTNGVFWLFDAWRRSTVRMHRLARFGHASRLVDYAEGPQEGEAESPMGIRTLLP